MRKTKISIIGLGYVGLPTALILSNSKNKLGYKYFTVYGIDRKINLIKKKLKEYSSGKTKLSEDNKLKKLFKSSLKNNKIQLSDNFNLLPKSKIILISVGFNFSKNNQSKQFKNLKDLITGICFKIQKKTLVIMETTLPPGTCENFIIPLMRKNLKRRGINFDKEIYFGFSFERIMPGKNYVDSVINNYRCYSGINRKSKQEIKKFLKKFINYKRFPLSELPSLKDCEAAKILENSYRAINIALIDEWTKYSIKENLNLNKIIKAIKKRETHNNLMRPGLGVGGYCLTKDPAFMSINKSSINETIKFPIINSALKINKKMPQTSIELLKKKMGKFKNKKILIMGSSYKADVADNRNSPTNYLINFFKKRKINFAIDDPFQKKTVNNYKNFDVVLFCVNHSNYKYLKLNNFSSRAHFFDLNSVLTNKQINLIKKKKLKLDILGGD